MTACSADGNCKGVYDNGCNAKANDIYLCPNLAIYRNSIGSCIYQKNENGNYFKSFYFNNKLNPSILEHIYASMYLHFYTD